jgi:cell division septal protein FtsQ
VSFARPARDAGHIAPRETAPVERHGGRAVARLAGATGLLLLTAALFWMLTDEAFTVTSADVSFEGLAHADESQLRTALADLERGPNVFRVQASEIIGQLAARPEVDGARARVTIPAGVTITLDERDPVFIWTDGVVSWLVDEEGMLFAPAELEGAGDATAADAVLAGGTPAGAEVAAIEAEATAAPARSVLPSAAARATLPVVQDARIPLEEPTLGSHLSAADLAVMRLLLAVTPEMVGSKAATLQLRVDENDGYTLTDDELGWRALFGHYTPTLQAPEDIPRQVQCLRWLLADRGERRVERVYLALSEEGCGTFSELDRKQAGGD